MVNETSMSLLAASLAILALGRTAFAMDDQPSVGLSEV
jgi:hypothetical protein